MPETLRGVDRRSVLNDPAARATRSGSAPARRASSGPRCTSPTCAFEPHRHDTYAIGITTSGVQTFSYRGARRICLPGQLHVLHPDETHDGAAGTDDGFGYRILYIAPELVRARSAAARCRSSPSPCTADPGDAVVASLLADIDEPITDLARAEIAATVADRSLARAADRRPPRGEIDDRAVELVRDYLAAHAASRRPPATRADRGNRPLHDRPPLPAGATERAPTATGRMRRLALARTAIESGRPLARAAADAGFADQSHMTRQFKRGYGLTPASWAKAVSSAARGTPAAA